MCVFLKVSPFFDPLRDDPRFQKLVETVFGSEVLDPLSPKGRG